MAWPNDNTAAIADQEVEGAGEQRKAQRLHHEIRIDPGQRHGDQQHRHDDEADHLVGGGAAGGGNGVVGDGGHGGILDPKFAAARSPGPSGRSA